MSLQVWLPLNGDLKNKGVANTNIGSIITAQGSFISDGKIGQGLKTGTSNSISTEYTPDCIKDLTLCGWFKFNKAEIAAVLESKTYSSAASKATGNLIGNSHYGGIGLCWEGNAMNTTKVFTTLRIFASIRGNSSLYTTGSIDVDFDKWYHLMLIWDSTNKILNFYVNGAIYKTGNVTNAGTIRDYPININYSGIYGGQGPTANIPFVTNDVRIYDHCLSQVEIKEISRGLVCHYKLDDFSPNANLFSWKNMGANVITLNDYQNTGSFTQFHNSLIIDPSTTIGTKYTISLWARSPNGNTKLQIYNRNSNPRYFYFDPIILTNNLGTEWQYFTCTITNIDRGSGLEDGYSKRIEIYMPNQMGGQVKLIKIEEGEIATPWIPSIQDSLYNTLDYGSKLIKDSSGYNNHSLCNNLPTISLNTARNSCSTQFGTIRLPYSYLIDPSFLSCLSNCTLCWWEYSMSTSDTLPFSSSSTQYIAAGSPTTQLYDRNIGMSGITMYVDGVEKTTTYQESSSRVNHTALRKKDEWHFMCLTGIDLSAWTQFYINNYPSDWPLNALLSDIRLYATALSAEDIKELYQVSAKIDKDGNFHAFEGIEDQSAIKINKQGQVKVLEINENNKMSFDKTGDLNTYEYIEF